MAQELVLSLHGIDTPHDCVGTEERFYWVTREAFTMLLENIVATRATADTPTVITFDDGNASDATIALPELAKRGLKAAFFVCAGRNRRSPLFGSSGSRGPTRGRHGDRHSRHGSPRLENTRRSRA